MATPCPLVDAAREGHLQEVTRLLNSGVDINQKNNNGYTALLLASERGHLTIATLLLDRGASIDLQSNTGGDTALHYACYNGKANIGSLLLERGANASIKNNEGKTALDYARQNNKPDCVAILQNHEEQEKVLITKMPRMINQMMILLGEMREDSLRSKEEFARKLTNVEEKLQSSRNETAELRNEITLQMNGLHDQITEQLSEHQEITSHQINLQTTGLRGEITDQITELRNESAELRGEITGLRNESVVLRAQIIEFQEHTTEQISGLREQTSHDIGLLKHDFEELKLSFQSEMKSCVDLVVARDQEISQLKQSLERETEQISRLRGEIIVKDRELARLDDMIHGV